MLLKMVDPLPSPSQSPNALSPPPPSPIPKSILSFRPAGSHMLLVLQDRQWALSRHLAMKVIPGIPFPDALCTAVTVYCHG